MINAANITVLITRPREDSKQLLLRASAIGIRCAVLPMFVIQSLLHESLCGHIQDSLHVADLVICVSKNAVRVLQQAQISLCVARWATVGPMTAGFLRDAHVNMVIFPEQPPYDAQAMLRCIGNFGLDVDRAHVVGMVGLGYDRGLYHELSNCAAKIDMLEIYQRVRPKYDAMLVRHILERVEIIVITCKTSLENLLFMAGTWQGLLGKYLLVVSDRLLRYAQEAGFTRVVLTQGVDDEDILEGVLACKSEMIASAR